MTVTVDQHAIVREVAIAARPDFVWKLLVDEKEAVRWMGVEAHLDPEPGGVYRVTVIPGHTASGKFVEIDPPRRLVFTWGWENDTGVPPGSSTVIFELVPTSNGTLVRLTHRDLPTTNATESHTHGWTHYLERLAIAGRGAHPGRDPWLDRVNK